MMKLSLLLFVASAFAAGPAEDPKLEPVVRQGSTLLLDGQPWKAVGPNVYWLGLDENVTPLAGEPFDPSTNASYPTKGRITEVMAIVTAMGGTMIRAHTLGVSTGNPLSVMPTLGKINEAAFDSIDWAVFQAREYGIRLLVPLTDNWDYYHGGRYTFLRWAGFNLTQASDSSSPLVQQFYTNATIIASFKDYTTKLLTHVNKYTNISYADDPTIFAYETGNELSNVPTEWLTEIAKHLKSLAPNKLVVDGTFNVNQAHLNIPEVDIFSSHFYPPTASRVQSDLRLVATANKTYIAGEYGWIDKNGGSSNPSTDSLVSFFQELERSPSAGGDMFWSLFGHNVPNCNIFVNHSDGYTLQYGNPQNSADVNTRIQLIRRHFVKMSQGVDINATAALPVVPCPAPDHG